MNPYIEVVKKNFQQSSRKTLKESLYDAFRKTIILREIPAGERINEKEYAELLNISRTPIRYALQELTKEGLVEHIPKIGTVVKGISISDAYEIFDIRKALDILATTKAAQLMTAEDFDDLKELLKHGDYLDRTDQVDLLLKNFTDFNQFIYDKSQMPRMKNIAETLREYLLYFRDVSIRAAERRHIALKEHWQLYEAMKKRDEETIRRVTSEHLGHSLTFIIQEMEKRQID
ncbi:GntR family transcriptional regulator [Streptococcus chenjunshii]|uniref:GntR family transcriptional regulator n=1 Tax=Streptococcus chenjunshii TaxID=2173853 RepID=A0A372KJE6_9STRE|nr:GntR family transcriptional regulator [Streptococcus chenjunshii]AXQ78324.1 GntR family transcriptional regulator [Streptococcus chenjunshii]RFU50065.1 GntR family transcriptional regulator [Streptococcus chenjunshii]RFU52421.1 GntR family transcriptional regulator [Streptococcus chenjunshii]